MATQLLSRSLVFKPPTTSTKTLITSLLGRSFSTASPSAAALRPSLLRFISSAVHVTSASLPISFPSTRAFATNTASSSLNESQPNWSNRPPKETILLDGCDFEHWLVVMEKPEGDPTRDEIIDSYIKTLAMVVGSEEEARMKIYSVSTRCYYAFGALVSEELSYKLKELPRVRWVLPDSYLNVKEKDYGGEPFINGQAVPYDPKYHEEWERNHQRAMERNRRNDRPRNNDRSRNFSRPRNVQNQDFRNTQTPQMGNTGMPKSAPNMTGYAQNPPIQGGYPQNNMVPPNQAGYLQNNMVPPGQAGYRPNSPPQPGVNTGGMQQNVRPPVGPPPNNYNMHPSNPGMPPSNMGQLPANPGWSNSVPGNMQQQNFQNGPNSGMPHPGAQQNYQSGFNPGRDGNMQGPYTG